MSAPNDAEGGAPPAPDVFDKEPRDDDADSDKVVEEGGEVAPRGELDEIFKFCVCQDQRAAVSCGRSIIPAHHWRDLLQNRHLLPPSAPQLLLLR